MKNFFAVMFVLFSTNFALFSCQSIKQINSYDEVDFESITPDTLVVFDVDNTLIRSLQNEEKLFLEFITEYFTYCFSSEDLKRENFAKASSLFLKECPRPLIEKQIVSTIKKLQEKGVSVIACTAINTGEHGLIESMEEWRYHHLFSLGFQGSFGDRTNNLYAWNESIRGCNSIMISDKIPLFHKGIICTNLHPKGECLGRFLDAQHYLFFDHKFEKIVMFDDMATYPFLGSVVEECKKRNMDCDAYLYQGSVTVPYEQEDLEKQKAQARYLAHYEKWPSDQELELFLEKEMRENEKQGRVKK